MLTPNLAEPMDNGRRAIMCVQATGRPSLKYGSGTVDQRREHGDIGVLKPTRLQE